MNPDIGLIGYILIINSDPAMRQTLSGYFSDHNFPARCVSNWSELKCTGTPSLIIKDQSHGLDQLRSIRSTSDIPIIMTGGTAPTNLIQSSTSNSAPTTTS